MVCTQRQFHAELQGKQEEGPFGGGDSEEGLTGPSPDMPWGDLRPEERAQPGEWKEGGR